jgi:hypothetical protein
MKKPLTILFCSLFITSFAQKTKDIAVDQLTAPTSPGFLILGKEVTNVEKPTTPTDFIVSLRSATGDFSALPKNFAIDISPFWVFGASKTEYKDLTSNDPWKNMKHSFQLSFATQTTKKTNSANDSSQMGVGFKFSLFRGKVNSDFDKLRGKLYEKLKVLLDLQGGNINELEKNDPVLQKINAELKITTDPNKQSSLLIEYTKRQETLKSEAPKATTDLEKELSDLAKSIKYTRYGWKLDFAGGWVYSFPTQSFDKAQINRFGAWLTGGYETEKKDNNNYWSFLGVVRYLQNYQEVFKDANNQILPSNNQYLDTGLRVISTLKEKVSLSAEIVNRQNIDASKNIVSTVRYTFNINYQLPENTILSFTYGKDFDGTIRKDGNLIAALNLIKGIGSKRPIN